MEFDNWTVLIGFSMPLLGLKEGYFSIGKIILWPIYSFEDLIAFVTYDQIAYRGRLYMD